MSVNNEPELAALRLRDATVLMIWALRYGASTERIEAEWKHIEQAYNEFRHTLEKKVSEG